MTSAVDRTPPIQLRKIGRVCVIAEKRFVLFIFVEELVNVCNPEIFVNFVERINRELRENEDNM